jgi:hypothetical protein
VPEQAGAFSLLIYPGRTPDFRNCAPRISLDPIPASCHPQKWKGIALRDPFSISPQGETGSLFLILAAGQSSGRPP